jgi:hypothetical protein
MTGGKQRSTRERLWSAITAMGAWSLALVTWRLLVSGFAPFGTVVFYIQLVVILGIALPWIGLLLSVKNRPLA